MKKPGKERTRSRQKLRQHDFSGPASRSSNRLFWLTRPSRRVGHFSRTTRMLAYIPRAAFRKPRSGCLSNIFRNDGARRIRCWRDARIGFESTSTPDVLRDSRRGQNLRHCYCATGLLRDESPDAQIETITVPLSGYHPFSASYFQISSSAPSHGFGPRLHRGSVCDPTTQSYPSPLLLRASFASSSPFSADLVWAERRS